MPRKRRTWKNRPGKYRGGRVVINHRDYTRRDYMSPGRLVAWAEWVPHPPKKRRGKSAKKALENKTHARTTRNV